MANLQGAPAARAELSIFAVFDVTALTLVAVTEPLKANFGTPAPGLFWGWFGISVVQRALIAYSQSGLQDEGLSQAEDRKETTLIIGRFDVMRFKALADGPLRRIVVVDPDPTAEHPVRIEERTIGRGVDCASKRRSALYNAIDILTAVGRIDECLLERRLDFVPDGLVLQTHVDMRVMNLGTGCCTTVKVGLRRNGEIQKSLTWSMGQALVLSYFPDFGHLIDPRAFGILVQTPRSLWSAGPGPLQLVQYGRPPATAEAAVSWIFRVDPSAPLAAAEGDPAEWERRIEMVAATTPSVLACEAVFKLAHRGRNTSNVVVTDRILRLASNCIGFDWRDAFPGLSTYFDRLSREDKRRLGALLLERLTTPGVCPMCRQSESGFYRRPDKKEPFRARAIAAFASQRDLAFWQYEGLLHLSGDSPVTFENRAEAMAAVLSEPSAFSRRARAFGRVYLALSDEELDALGARLNLVPRAERDEFLRQVHPNTWSKTPNSPAAIARFKNALQAPGAFPP